MNSFKVDMNSQKIKEMTLKLLIWKKMHGITNKNLLITKIVPSKMRAMAVRVILALYLTPNIKKMQSFAHILSLLWEKFLHSHTHICMDQLRPILDLTMDSNV